MKTKHYKIILFISLFTLLFTFFLIPSFAYDFNGVITNGQELTFSETLNFGFIPDKLDFTFYISNDPDEMPFTSIVYDSSGGDSITYKSTITFSSVTVYDSSQGGWLDDSYRHIISLEDSILSGDNLGFISTNLFDPSSSTSDGFYDVLFDLITSTIYGDRELTSFEVNISTILSSIICVCVFALPFIILFWLVKFIFTIGRNW